jgi:hypothetical protein
LVPVNPLQDRGDPQNLDGDPHLLRQFPPDGLLQGLPQFHQTAGKTPDPQGRFLAPQHQEDLFAPEDDGAYAYEGLVGIVSFDGGYLR